MNQAVLVARAALGRAPPRRALVAFAVFSVAVTDTLLVTVRRIDFLRAAGSARSELRGRCPDLPGGGRAGHRHRRHLTVRADVDRHALDREDDRQAVGQ
jgi:hypothetical protein